MSEKKQMDDFVVSPDYPGYVYVGHAEGTFENDKGKRYPYAHMFVLTQAKDNEQSGYYAAGLKADKKKCDSPRVWEGLNFGDHVRLFFDDRGKVIQAAIDE